MLRTTVIKADKKRQVNWVSPIIYRRKQRESPCFLQNGNMNDRLKLFVVELPVAENPNSIFLVC